MSSPPLVGFLDEVKLNRTHLSKQSLRTDLGDLDELMLSIDKVGLLQPIVIRPIADKYEVVAGNRRFEACRRLRWIKIPCHIVELDDKEAFEISLVENVQRNMLNTIEEAKAFSRYVEENGWGSVSDLARRIGKNQVYVSKRLRLLKLPEDVQMAISENRISPSIGEEIMSLEEEGERIELGRRAIEEKLSRSEVREIVKRIKNEHDTVDYSSFVDSIPYTYSDLERQQRTTDRALAKSIAALKVALYRIDDSLDLLESGWVIRELLFEHRKSVHSNIDALINLRKRVSKHPGK
jgi:ParB family chromosome partitioning protein|tara:strand:+ start:587 stop:1468 length:882 start_codon:yes stop_codon:yes gene_type:complete